MLDRWPDRAAYAAAGWSLAYGLLGLFWTTKAAGFPFGRAHDPDGRHVSILYPIAQDTLAPVIAVIGLAGAVLALVMARLHRPEGAARRALLVWSCALAGTLAVVVPDYRPLLAVVRAPMLLAGAPFGYPKQMGLSEFFPTFVPWPVLNQILFIIGGLLWAATALSFARRTRLACGHCGRGGTGDGGRWTDPRRAARWGRIAAYTAMAVPLLYCVSRWSFALNIPFGTTREALEAENRENPGIWIGGAMLATMGAAGSLLTVGLVRRWGEVYPRWIPRLGGRPVHPRTAVLPASLVSLLLLQTSLMELRAALLGDQPDSLTGPNWGLVLPGQSFIVWALALAAATLAYHLRRRGTCRRCGRGDTADAPVISGARTP